MIATLFDKMIPHVLLGLFARLMIAMTFLTSGLTKVDGFSIKNSTYYLFENEYALPLIPSDIAAVMATISEFVFPALLILGLFSRLSAAALLGMPLVIQIFVYPNAYATHGLWAVALLYIMKYGPGMVSLDHFWHKKSA